MLDAAEAVVVRQGIGNLTLDAVAVEARMSKGGLLHHFPSKDSLVEGLVSRCAEHWRQGVLAVVEETPEGPGRMARALLGHLADSEGWSEQCQQSSCAVFAALAQNPRLIEPMRAVYAELRERLTDDGLAPGVGETILAAMDGLWLNRVLGLAPVNRTRMELIGATLAKLLAPGAGSHKPAGGRARAAASGRRAALRSKKKGSGS